MMDPFSFASSEALDIYVNVRVVSLEGEQTPIPFSTLIRRPDLRHIGSNLSPNSDLYVTVQLWADSKPLTVPVRTPYKAFRHERKWNEWLTLPINYSTLPLSSQLAVTIWDLSPTGGEGAHGHAIPFGGTTLPLFDKENQLQKGRQKCYVHRRKAADGLDSTTTPSTLPKTRTNGTKGKATVEVLDKEDEELERLEKLFKKHEMGEIPKIEWLDQLVFRGLEKRGLQATSTSLKALQKRRSRRYTNDLNLDGEALDTTGDKKDAKDVDEAAIEDERFTLYLELPRFDFPIVFQDHEYARPPISSLMQLSSSQSNVVLKPPPEVQFGPGINGPGKSEELGGRLVRIYDPEVGARDNPAESKHRRLVRSHKSGVLDKDLRPNAKLRDELNHILTYSPTHVLSPDEKDLIWKYRYHLTRDKKGITKFVKAVNWQELSEAKDAINMLDKFWKDIDIDDALELLGPSFDTAEVRKFAVDRLEVADDDEILLYLLQLVQALKFESISETIEDALQSSSLASFLIRRAAKNFTLGNHFHWYLMVECDDKPDQGPGYRKLFAKVEYDFMMKLTETPAGQEMRKDLLRQAELIAVLSRITMDIQMAKETVPRKLDRLKQYLADPKNELTTIDPPLPLPIDPSVKVIGIDPSEANVFKSSLSPSMVTFKTEDGKKYQIIFKTGDDLRQDQLVIQIITLMDQLLQKENLDLKLSPYKILATAEKAGAVQFVPSMTLQSMKMKFKGNAVLEYLKSNNPDNKAPLGVRREALDTYIKSCAGYCVITYLLGVGDRHLDNLLLAPSGHFFHADFGYILGRDPKPFAPAMKLCTEMVDGMGGASSKNYTDFKQYCFTAYTALRKSSNLILNLFSLMVDANIPDIRIEPDKVVLKVKERFHLEMTEEEAIRHFDALIEDGPKALFPVFIDRLHGIAQNFRA